MLHSDQKTKQNLSINIKKVQGMSKKIQNMVDNNIYCGDIIQQINATIGLLKKMNQTLLSSHLLTCGSQKLIGDNQEEKEVFVKELIRLIEKS